MSITDINFAYAVLSAADKTLKITGINAATAKYASTVSWGAFPAIPLVYAGTNTLYNGNGTPSNAYKITEIGDYAFYNNLLFDATPLTATFLPANLTRIGQSAFSGVKLQGTLTIPQNVTTVDFQAFYNCTLITYKPRNNRP